MPWSQRLWDQRRRVHKGLPCQKDEDQSIQWGISNAHCYLFVCRCHRGRDRWSAHPRDECQRFIASHIPRANYRAEERRVGATPRECRQAWWETLPHPQVPTPHWTEMWRTCPLQAIPDAIQEEGSHQWGNAEDDGDGIGIAISVSLCLSRCPCVQKGGPSSILRGLSQIESRHPFRHRTGCRSGTHVYAAEGSSVPVQAEPIQGGENKRSRSMTDFSSGTWCPSVSSLRGRHSPDRRKKCCPHRIKRSTT